MLHRIPVLKTYISLISSNSLRSLQRVEGTVLNGHRLLKMFQNWKIQRKDWVHHSTAMAGGTWGCHCWCPAAGGRQRGTRLSKAWNKGIKCHHRRQEAHLKFTPSTGEAFFRKNNMTALKEAPKMIKSW